MGLSATRPHEPRAVSPVEGSEGEFLVLRFPTDERLLFWL